MSRIQAREFAFKVIFSLQFNFPSESTINNEDEGKSFFKLVNGNLQLNELAINEFLNAKNKKRDFGRSRFSYNILFLISHCSTARILHHQQSRY